MLTINNISASKNQKIIFKDLGFSCGLGSCLILSGKNGAGKTTLLKIIAGLFKPSQGDILWNGENIQNFYSDFAYDVNYIGHKNFLKPELTVLQNMQFYACLSGTQMALPSAIKYFSLEEILDKQIDQISSGMQKRVMLAKLLYQPKTIWLLDEPTINLDNDNKKRLFNLVSSRIKDGGIAIIASHDEIFEPIASKIELENFK